MEIQCTPVEAIVSAPTIKVLDGSVELSGDEPVLADESILESRYSPETEGAVHCERIAADDAVVCVW